MANKTRPLEPSATGAIRETRPARRILAFVAALSTFSVLALVLVANRAPVQPENGAALRANSQLVSRLEALRTAARDLSDQVCRRIEHELPREWLDGPGGHSPACLQPPSTDAANEDFLVWLSEQGALLESLATGPAGEAASAIGGR